MLGAAPAKQRNIIVRTIAAVAGSDAKCLQER